LVDATYEPAADIEQSSDYQQAKAVQSALTNIADNGSDPADEINWLPVPLVLPAARARQSREPPAPQGRLRLLPMTVLLRLLFSRLRAEIQRITRAVGSGSPAAEAGTKSPAAGPGIRAFAPGTGHPSRTGRHPACPPGEPGLLPADAVDGQIAPGPALIRIARLSGQQPGLDPDRFVKIGTENYSFSRQTEYNRFTTEYSREHTVNSSLLRSGLIVDT
jgi:hypothetical protein